MRIVLNGADTEVADGATLATALALLELPAEARGVAAAVDAEVVPRGAWAAHALHDGARVEVVRAVQGG